MGKSVLVIDTPANCLDCSIRVLDDGYPYCAVTHRFTTPKCVESVPEWCPLEDIRKIRTDYSEDK